MTLKLTRRTALASAAALAFTRSASAQTQGISTGEIVLGTHLDLSGPVAAGMPALRAGMQMRIDEANEKGGVHGRKLRLIVEDNGSQPQMAVRAATKLIQQDQVFAIVNPFGSGPNAAVIKRAVDAGIVYFSPWGASSVFRKISGNSPLLFTTTPNYDTTMAAGLRWALKEFGAKKVGFIYQEGPLGELVRAGVDVALKEAGQTLVAQSAYKAGDIDFSSHVARMKAAGTDLIVTATITRETIAVMAETKKLGWNDVKVLTSNPGRTLIVARLGGAAVEGLYGIGSWNVFPPAALPASIVPWAKTFKDVHKLDFDENGLLCYAYTDWFIRGLEAAGKDLTANGLVKALQGVESNHPVFYSPLRFKDGHIAPEVARVEQLKDGNWVAVSGTLA